VMKYITYSQNQQQSQPSTMRLGRR
jgi:hypothetical protein